MKNSMNKQKAGLIELPFGANAEGSSNVRRIEVANSKSERPTSFDEQFADD